VDVQLEVGDAEALPVADAAFDVVLSGFGAIFAPRHKVVAAELTRACRPGGTIAFTAWIPGGTNDRMFSVLTDYLPAPPEFTPHIIWGDPEHVRAVFAPHQVVFTFERPSLTVAFPSVEVFESFMLENSGGVITARRALEALGRWNDGYAALHEAIESLNEADDGRYRVTWDFLLAVGARSR
jgi:SAM-dependent methyltransferase